MDHEEDRLCDKLQMLMGRRQVLVDELALQRERIELVRAQGENLLHLVAAQGKALGVQAELVETYKGLSGGNLDARAALVFKQNILYIMSGSLPMVAEQAIMVFEEEECCKVSHAVRGGESSLPKAAGLEEAYVHADLGGRDLVPVCRKPPEEGAQLPEAEALALGRDVSVLHAAHKVP